MVFASANMGKVFRRFTKFWVNSPQAAIKVLVSDFIKTRATPNHGAPGQKVEALAGNNDLQVGLAQSLRHPRNCQNLLA